MTCLEAIAKNMADGVGEIKYEYPTFYNGETQIPNDGRRVFAYMLAMDYKTKEYTKEVPCIAEYVHKNSICAEDFFSEDYDDWEDDSDYDKEKDVWYVKESWYSSALFEEMIFPIRVSRWMEIPR